LAPKELCSFEEVKYLHIKHMCYVFLSILASCIYISS
jgi:hypothetical protein